MTLVPATRPAASNPAGPLMGDPPPSIPRDQWGRPLIAPSSSQGQWCRPVGMTRASTLGGTLEETWGLSRWQRRMVVIGMGLRPDLVLAASALTAAPEDKNGCDDIADRAFEHAEGSAGSTIGTALHGLLARILKGESIPAVRGFEETLTACREVVSRFTVYAIEQFIVCEEINSAGTTDLVVSPKGHLVAPDGTVFGPGDRLIWDWKTSQTSSYFGIKFCVQCFPYACGRPYRHLESRPTGRGKQIEVRGVYDDWPDGVHPSLDWALICHAPSGGTTADLYWVPLKEGRELAELSNTVRNWRKAKLIVPAELPSPLDSVTEATYLDHATTLIESIRGADTLAALDQLWNRYGETSAWTDECTLAAKVSAEKIERGQVSQVSLDKSLAALAVPPAEPLQVALTRLKGAIHGSKSEDELIELWEKYGDDGSNVWTEACTRMARAVRAKF